jgi:uncharacterized repeat protein (TIGR01451 family)
MLWNPHGQPSFSTLIFTALVIAMSGPLPAADVNLTIGTLPPQGTVTIEFEVQIDDPVAPLATTHAVCNQATISGSNFTSLLTDDLELGGPGATCTSLPDFGDAPAPFPTMLAANGARHGLRSDLFLGATADAEPDGQPNASATGDDIDGNDDADGVTFASYEGALPALIPGVSNTLDVFLNSGGDPCQLNAWIDFNGNGSWADAGEQIFTNQPLSAGANNGLPYDVPAGAVIGTTYSRFRCSTTASLLPTGEAPDGEVEDYQVLVAQSSISVTKTASPTSLAEPGGSVTFTVTINNTGNTSVDITSLGDDVHGNLNGQGTCSVPQTIPVSGSYQCSFSATVSGTSGDSETDTVTASGTGVGGPVADSGSATVTITDPPPTISVTKTASPTSVPEPGASVSFTVRVDNTGSTSADLTSLTDDIHGDLNGQGDCSLPKTIAIGGFYQCSFSATVTGDAGDSETDTVTASVTGPGGSGSAMGSATVTVTDELPTISVSKTASPASIEEPGGTITFTVRVDNTGAAEPVSLTSLNDDIHGDLNGQGDCSLPQTIAVSDFYECSFDASVTGVAGDSETDTVTATAEDNEGNPVSEQDSATVNIIDPTPPVVTALVTVPGGALDECTTVTAAITSFDVTFNEELANPTDAGGYLLVGSGPDFDFSTLDCNGASGDDEAVAFSDITSDGDPATPTVSLAVTDLAAGLYRLLICDILTDVDGNPLDGDESGDGGGNLIRSFRADPGNLFVNGDFDHCPVSLSPWDSFATAPDAVLPAVPGTSDRDGSPLSAAVELMSSTGDELGIGQCIPVDPEADYQLRAWLQVAGLGGDDPLATFVRRCAFYAQPGCAGDEIGSGVFVSVVTDTEGGWLAYLSSLLSPAGVASASCELAIVPASGSQSDVLMDGLFFGAEELSPGELIFTDGFESGDVSAWSATVP